MEYSFAHILMMDTSKRSNQHISTAEVSIYEYLSTLSETSVDGNCIVGYITCTNTWSTLSKGGQLVMSQRA